MPIPVLTENSGFTLVEFLVAIVIMSVGILGLLQTVNLSISHNMVNQLRQESTMLADGELAKEMAKGSSTLGFEAISTPTSPYVSRYSVRRQVLNGYRNYSVTRTNSLVTPNTKQVNVQVVWRYKQDRFTHGASSLITKMQQ